MRFTVQRVMQLGLALAVASTWLLFETLRFKLLVTALALLLFGRRPRLGAVGLFIAALAMLPPRRPTPSARAQTFVLDERGESVAWPLSVLISSLVPETELARLSILLAPIFPFPTRGALLREVRSLKPFDNVVTREYRRVQSLGLERAAPSILPFQAAQQLGGYRDLHAFTVILPAHIRADHPLPVVIFLHGYLGHFQFYESFWQSQNEAVVLIPTTQNLLGLWSAEDLDYALGPELDHVATLAPIDRNRLHLVGLSNGGSGVNRAMKTRSAQFRSMTWLSTWVEKYRPAGPLPKLAIISGQDDSISTNNRAAATWWRGQGAIVNEQRFAGEGHLVMLTQRARVLDALLATLH